MESRIYQRFTRGRGRPRKLVEPVTPLKPLQSNDLVHNLFSKKLISQDMHHACMLYRTYYFQFCRLAFAPRLSQTNYQDPTGRRGENFSYTFAGLETYKDQFCEKRYLKMRQGLLEKCGPGAQLFHNWVLYAQFDPYHPFDPSNLKVFCQVCQVLLKDIKTTV